MCLSLVNAMSYQEWNRRKKQTGRGCEQKYWEGAADNWEGSVVVGYCCFLELRVEINYVNWDVLQ